MSDVRKLLELFAENSRLIRWLTGHWEWCFVLGVLVHFWFVTTNLEYREALLILPFLFLTPLPFFIVMAFLVNAKRNAIAVAMRIAGWAAYAWFVDAFLLTHPGAKTLAEVYAGKVALDQAYPGIIFSMLMGAGAIFCLLMAWTRWVRIQPDPIERREFAMRMVRACTYWIIEKTAPVLSLGLSALMIAPAISDEANAAIRANFWPFLACYMAAATGCLILIVLWYELPKRWEGKM